MFSFFASVHAHVLLLPPPPPFFFFLFDSCTFEIRFALPSCIILSIRIEFFFRPLFGKKREWGAFLFWSSFFSRARRNVSCRSYTRSSPRRAMIAPRPFWRSTPRIPGTFLPSPRRCVVVFVASTCSPSSRLNFFPFEQRTRKKSVVRARVVVVVVASSAHLSHLSNDPTKQHTPGVRESPAIRLGQVHVQRGQTHV